MPSTPLRSFVAKKFTLLREFNLRGEINEMRARRMMNDIDARLLALEEGGYPASPLHDERRVNRALRKLVNEYGHMSQVQEYLVGLTQRYARDVRFGLVFSSTQHFGNAQQMIVLADMLYKKSPKVTARADAMAMTDCAGQILSIAVPSMTQAWHNAGADRFAERIISRLKETPHPVTEQKLRDPNKQLSIEVS